MAIGELLLSNHTSARWWGHNTGFRVHTCLST